MASKVLSIEVCDETITVCRTARKGKGVRVFDSFLFPTPPGCVSDGVILDPLPLSEELKRQLEAHKLQRVKSVVFVLSSSKIAIREVRLPNMKKKLISAAVRTNAGDYFPIDLSEYYVTYSILESVSGSKNKKPALRILVMAAPLSMLESCYQLADKAGLTVKSIDTAGNSQYQLLKSIGTKKVTAYVDISGSSSIVSFMKDGKLLLQRMFAFGAEEVISHYMSVSGSASENYLDALNETDLTSPAFVADKLLSENELQSELSRLVNGIARSIDYYNSGRTDAPVTMIVLVGLNRHLIGLREMTVEATGLEVVYLDDIPAFAGITNNAPEAPSFISCIGSIIAPLDLLPPQFASPRKKNAGDKKESYASSIVVASVIIIASALAAVFSYMNYSASLIELVNVNNEISSLQYAKDAHDYYVAYKDSEDAVNALDAERANPNSQLVGFFHELEQEMPSSINLLSADCTADGVSMNVTVGSYTEAAAVISALRSFDSLSNVSASDFSSSKNETGAERISFTVSCTYGTNPYLNNVNPYGGLIAPADASSDTGTDQAAETQDGQ